MAIIKDERCVFGELSMQYLGLSNLVEILKDGFGTGVATLVGWMLMKSPLRKD
jgi:hypothetical protein